ncbi:pheromone processing endoprotease [Xylographa carneopallida]|nr:pheromone processing endoprotease [Xylographa carneopallida]
MHYSTCLGLLALAALVSPEVLKPRDYNTHDYYTLHLESDVSPADVAAALGVKYEGMVGELKDHYYFSAPIASNHGVGDRLDELKNRRRKRAVGMSGNPLDKILWSRQQQLKPRMEKRSAIPPVPERAPPVIEGSPDSTGDYTTAAIGQRQEIARQLSIRDPIFADQWHLFNSVQRGHDVNVTGLWLEGITGHNATVVVVDDGLDMYSDDLKDNYFAEGSYDFNDQTDEPRPRLNDDKHGTRCAGEIAAVRNNVCGVGVAYDAKVAGLRILSKSISDEDEAVAINYQMQKNQIYSCSWGPPDNGMSMDAPGTLIKRAMVNGIQNGRGGKGSIFVFAAGNGAAADDNCNFDGYTNSIYSITVGAIDRKGLHPYYSEKCSAQLVVTYSSGSGDAIHTTDVGSDKCYSNHGGTSAAAPLGAGIFALVLGVRPDLSWRDLQYLCVQTAVPVNEQEEWQTTTIGKKYSHTYGYGKLDAYALVEAAKSFVSVKPQAWYKSAWQHVNHDIPQGDQGLSSSVIVTKDMLQKANLERVEHVTVTMNIDHTRRGDLNVDLISPEGLVSHISTTRRNDGHKSGYVDWTFMSVVHWGESGIGEWTILVKDTNENEHSGTFTDWRMTLWGESIDGSKQELYPMPTDHDDDDHDAVTAVVSTTTFAPGSKQTDLPAQPSDHPDRPVNAKPSVIETSTAFPTASASVSASESSADTGATASPTTTSGSDTSPTSTPSSYLPSIFPTFGVSARTQVWIYGAATAILLFCVALGTFFFIWRRRNARMNRADYEFEILDDQDGAVGAPLSVGQGRKKRRGGELYDAFAGESDEEIFSEGEETEYKDEAPGKGSAPKQETSEK